LLTYVNQHRQHRPVGHYFSLPVMTHDFLNPGIFGPGYFNKEFDETWTFSEDWLSLNSDKRDFIWLGEGNTSQKIIDILKEKI
jgi:hypothetical protein